MAEEFSQEDLNEYIKRMRDDNYSKTIEKAQQSFEKIDKSIQEAIKTVEDTRLKEQFEEIHRYIEENKNSDKVSLEIIEKLLETFEDFKREERARYDSIYKDPKVLEKELEKLNNISEFMKEILHQSYIDRDNNKLDKLHQQTKLSQILHKVWGYLDSYKDLLRSINKFMSNDWVKLAIAMFGAQIPKVIHDIGRTSPVWARIGSHLSSLNKSLAVYSKEMNAQELKQKELLKFWDNRAKEYYTKKPGVIYQGVRQDIPKLTGPTAPKMYRSEMLKQFGINPDISDELLEKLSPNLKKILDEESIKDGITINIDKQGNIIKNKDSLSTKITNWVRNTYRGIYNNIQSISKPAVDFWKYLEKTGETFKPLGASLKGFKTLLSSFGKILRIGGQAVKWITLFWDGIAGWLQTDGEWYDKLKGVCANIARGFINAFQDISNFLTPIYTFLPNLIYKPIARAINNVLPFGLKIPEQLGYIFTDEEKKNSAQAAASLFGVVDVSEKGTGIYVPMKSGSYWSNIGVAWSGKGYDMQKAYEHSDPSTGLSKINKSILGTDKPTGDPVSSLNGNELPYIASSTADMSYIQPKLKDRLMKAATEMFQKTGEKPIITSAFRSNKKQAELWYRGYVKHEPGIYTPAAPVYDEVINGYPVKGTGRTMRTGHLVGGAIDVSNWQKFKPYAVKYGLSWQGSKDPVHFQINDLLRVPNTRKVSAATLYKGSEEGLKDFIRQAEEEIQAQEIKLGRPFTKAERDRYYEALRQREAAEITTEESITPFEVNETGEVSIESSEPMSWDQAYEAAMNELSNFQKSYSGFASGSSGKVSTFSDQNTQSNQFSNNSSQTSTTQTITSQPQSFILPWPSNPGFTGVDNAAMDMQQLKVNRS